jgi:hypothetical protein
MENAFITRLEYEARNVQVREDSRSLSENIDALRHELNEVKQSIDSLKFNTLKFLLNTGISFFLGGGGFTIFLKLTGKL